MAGVINADWIVKRFRKVIQESEAYDDHYSSFGSLILDLDSDIDDATGGEFSSDVIGEIRLVDGDEREQFHIIHHTPSDTYWEISSYYDSWDGGWNDEQIHQVRPVEITIQKWERVKNG